MIDMDIFSLSAKIKLDSSEFTDGLKKAGEKIGELGSKVGSAMGKIAKVSAAGIAAGATAVGAVVKQVTDAYGQYQQLVGGAEVLFGQASDTVIANAQKAFSTANMSANEYLETATSFASSLIQSTGRGAQQDIDALTEALDQELLETKRALEDEYDAAKKSWEDRIALAKEAGNENIDLLKDQKDSELKALKRSNQDALELMKDRHKQQIAEAEAMNMTSESTEASLQRAAELTDLAMGDMADNVNRMGSNMESIRNAYAGFAKQNYTMLDNLKLGYGGTKAEMERLLKDAERLSKKKFDISSYADIVEAIHVIQDEMGITNATLEETDSTLTGSIAATKAAWQNLLIGLGDSNADLNKLVTDLVTRATKSVENIAPIVKTALQGIGTVITQEGPELIGKLPEVIKSAIPELTTTATTLIKAFTNELPGIVSAIGEIAPDVLGAVGEVFGGIIEAIPESIDSITKLLTDDNGKLVEMVKQAGDFLVEQIPTIVNSGLNLFSALLDDLPGIVANLTAKLPEFIDRLLGTGKYEGQGLLAHIPDVLDAGIDLLGSLLDNLPAIMDSLSQGISQFVTELCDWLTDEENIKKLLGVGWKFTQAIVQGMGNVIENAGNWFAENVLGIDSASDEAFDLMQVMKDIKNGVDPEVAFARGNQRREYHDKAFDAIFSGDENAALYYMSGGREWIGQRPGAVIEVNNYGVSPKEVTDEVTKALNKTGVYAQ